MEGLFSSRVVGQRPMKSGGKRCDRWPPGFYEPRPPLPACTHAELGDGSICPVGECPRVRAGAWVASTRAVFRYTLPLGMRLLLRLPADSLLPGQTPAQEASWETFPNTFMSTPSSAMITAASVQCTPWDFLQQGQLSLVGLAGSLSSQSKSRPPSNRLPTMLVPRTDPSSRHRQLNLIFIRGGAPKAHEVLSKGRSPRQRG